MVFFYAKISKLNQLLMQKKSPHKMQGDFRISVEKSIISKLNRLLLQNVDTMYNQHFHLLNSLLLE